MNGDVKILPDGWYEDDEGLFRTADGGYIPDGVYKNSAGSVIMYEGIFEKYGFSADRPATANI